MEDVHRLPPVDLEAEEAFLGSLLIDPDVIHEIDGLVQPTDFYREAHRMVFDAMIAVTGNEESLDIITLSAELRRQDQLEEVGGEAFIIGLINLVPTSVNALSYARIIRDRAISRDLIRAASKIANSAYEDDAGTALDEAEGLLLEVRRTDRRGGLQSARGAASEYIEAVEALHASDGQLIGVPTGFKDLDRQLGGLPKESLIIIAGRPSMGKTALTLQMAYTSAMAGLRVAYFSLEMSKHEIMGRLSSSKLRIDSMRLRRGDLTEDEWPKFYQFMGEISESGLFIDPTPGISVGQIRSRGRRMAAREGLDILFVDYLQLMESDGKYQNRNLEVGEQTKGLKNLARELGIPVVVNSQLSRAVEQRQNKRPVLSDLRDSGNIEQDADVVSFLYRDDYYNPDSSERPNIAEVDVAKHRNGPTGTIDLYWHGQLAAFRDLARQEMDFGSGLNGTHASRTTKEPITL